jgi:hypothetical protein
LLVLAGLVVALAVAEVALRNQTRIPLAAWEDLQARRSSVLHHKYQPRDDDAMLSSHGDCQGAEPVILLFLGDSWLADGLMVSVLANRIAARCGVCVTAVNGATQSYAPSLYQLKGRLLAARFRPLLAFVNLDSTDPGDEWYRYSFAKLREPGTGRLLAVSFERDPYAVKMAERLRRYQGSPSYVVRLVGKWIHDRFVMPSLGRDELGGQEAWTILGPLTSPDAHRTHPEVVAEFDSAVHELFAELGTTLGAHRVYAFFHPHRGALFPEAAGERHSALVPELVAGAAREAGITFVDASPDLRAIHGADLEHAWLEGDPFSHLARPGLLRYANYAIRSVEADVCAQIDAARTGARAEGSGGPR